jgi:hypothetical protein
MAGFNGAEKISGKDEPQMNADIRGWGIMERCLACEAEGSPPVFYVCHDIERGWKWARITVGLAHDSLGR